MKNWKQKRVLIIGAGKSGLAAQKFLLARGAAVYMLDDKATETPHATPNTATHGNTLYDACVVSPGVPLTHPMVQRHRDRLMSELDLGFNFRRKIFRRPKIVAVTGTNGKTTTVNMINDAINGAHDRANGRRNARASVLCGNVGIPVTSVTNELRTKTAVVEVSSFQLELPPRHFRPDIGVILNLTQDHLERHGTMEEYAKCKARIGGRYLILNRDDENIYSHHFIWRSMRRIQPHILWFSMKSPVRGCYLDGDIIYTHVRGKNAKPAFNLSEFGETRPHMIQNILAVVLVCTLLRVPRDAVIAACRATTRPHRIELVAKRGGVEFYNDSKATNIASTVAACKCFDRDINLLLGGMGKGQDFTELFAELPSNVKNAYVFGRDADEIIAAAGDFPVHKCVDLKDAVRRAAALPESGEPDGGRIVLFSPACSSFDMFKNYEHRGDEFKRLVGELVAKM